MDTAEERSKLKLRLYTRGTFYDSFYGSIASQFVYGSADGSWELHLNEFDALEPVATGALKSLSGGQSKPLEVILPRDRHAKAVKNCWSMRFSGE